MRTASEHDDEMVRRGLTSFEEILGSADHVTVVRAPGRVNLIGDHTDYNDGFVLPMTIDRSACVSARARRDEEVVLYSTHFREKIRYPLHDMPISEAGSWTSYVGGVIEELRRAGGITSGVDMIVDGDIPLGAGLSSSAALNVAVAHALDVVFGLELDPIETVRLCRAVEHRYAGLECGIMDPFVSRFGRAGSALLLDCRSFEYEHIPFSPFSDSAAHLSLAIVDSRVTRELATSRYGVRHAECLQAAAAVREAHPSVESLRDVTPEMLSACRSDMDDRLYRRARHVLDENARVLNAADALRDGAFDRFGALMNGSHASLRDLFEVSCPELDTLVSAAQRTEGVLGARMTGGGFGGCTVNLVRTPAVGEFEATLRKAYLTAHGRSPRLYVVSRNDRTETLIDGRD